MRKMAVLLVVSFFIASGISFSEEIDNKDGSSIEKAVVIKYTGSHDKSIAQEYEYIKMKYGVQGRDFEINTQYLIHEDNKFYDKVIIRLLPSGEEKTLYFDITEPFTELQKQFQ